MNHAMETKTTDYSGQQFVCRSGNNKHQKQKANVHKKHKSSVGRILLQEDFFYLFSLGTPYSFLNNQK